MTRKSKWRPIPDSVYLVEQRAETCSIVCLCMLAGCSYDEALVAAKKVSKHVLGGLWGTEILKTARRLGLRLTKCLRWDWASDTGILMLETKSRQKRSWDGHTALLYSGLVYDPYERQLWRPDAYQARTDTKVRSLYRMEDE
ncbi:hypothetical protein LCGC14_0521150 [marine sediment metagenome]|uniref:Peptidase C39 domain-containing protein n=1 Tax=marine sediment metagenome TaxID=412755 RepID=A0A0F9SGW7_9ZZZZ